MYSVKKSTLNGIGITGLIVSICAELAWGHYISRLQIRKVSHQWDIPMEIVRTFGSSKEELGQTKRTQKAAVILRAECCSLDANTCKYIHSDSFDLSRDICVRRRESIGEDSGRRLTVQPHIHTGMWSNSSLCFPFQCISLITNVPTNPLAQTR